MSQPIVFFDLAGPDVQQLRTFYSAVFRWEPDDTGQYRIPVASPISAAFRADPVEKRFYIGVDDVAASLALVEEHGGEIDQPRFEVPGVVVLGLFRDPAGNPMGLVEMEGDAVRIP